MAENDQGLKEVKVKESSVPVVEVAVPDEPSAKYLRGQDEALMHYRLTGEAGVYIDPTRDQEPDIAPELGVAPHPELANPAPPASSFSGQALSVNANPMLVPVEEKAENAKEATEAFNEAVQAREEWASKQPFQGAAADAMPVYVVDAPGEGDSAGSSSLPADESPKSREGDPDAKVGGVADADAADAKDSDSKDG
jgi:hypothetical protein